ncbi:MAG: hypothetical protein JEZ11_21245 [Desulfobacterales bacterium]|nr:hypothetical protein [Desulfobacterales bacterium]
MEKYTRREVINIGSRLAAGAAISASYIPLLGCSAGNEDITAYQGYRIPMVLFTTGQDVTLSGPSIMDITNIGL